MAYRVNVHPRAERDLASIYAAIDAGNSEAAHRWFNGLEDALLTLEEHPARCPVTPEDKDLRHLLYGKKPHIYRVIFRISEKRRQVDILHIRHGARDEFDAGEVD